MTISGITITSISFGMETVSLPEKLAETQSSRTSRSVKQPMSDVQKAQETELTKLQNQQREQLSWPLRTISKASKAIGIGEQGILISKKPSIYDQELTRIRENGKIGKTESGQPLYLSIGISNRSTIGTEEYQDSDGTRIAVNQITGTIKWIDKDGNITQMLKKNLNGTVTKTQYTSTEKELSSNFMYCETWQQIRKITTYATENPDGKRTVQIITDDYNDYGYGPMKKNSTTVIKNYNESNNITSEKNGGLIDRQITNKKYTDATDQFYSDMVTDTINSILNYPMTRGY